MLEKPLPKSQSITAEEATGELVRNKVTENIVRPKPMSDMNSRNVEKIVI